MNSHSQAVRRLVPLLLVAAHICGCSTMHGAWYAVTDVGSSAEQPEQTGQTDPSASGSDATTLRLMLVNRTMRPVLVEKVEVHGSGVGRIRGLMHDMSRSAPKPVWTWCTKTPWPLSVGQVMTLTLPRVSDSKKCVLPGDVRITMDGGRERRIKISRELPPVFLEFLSHCAPSEAVDDSRTGASVGSDAPASTPGPQCAGGAEASD